MSELTSKQRAGVADTTILSVACSATIGLLLESIHLAGQPSAFHVGERPGQPRGESVIVKGCLDPAPGRRSHPRAQRLISEQSGDGTGGFPHVGRSSDHETGLTILHCFGSAA